MVGRRTLITGGDSGIGRAAALAFAREGADVAFTYLPAERPDDDALATHRGRRHAGVGARRRPAAINNLTVNLAAELGPKGIRVNAVAPGPIWTSLQPATQPVPKLMHFGQDTPLGRAGQPAEVAPALVFLASERDASYVSGTVLGVTGGKPVF